MRRLSSSRSSPILLTSEERDRAARFIRENLPLAVVPGTGIRLHFSGPRSGLARLVPAGGTPYWAHAWPGGVALAMHLLATPGDALPRSGREVGAGGGIATIAALLTGRDIRPSDPDPLALVALRLNAQANGVTAEPVPGGLHETAPDDPAWGPRLLLAGDVFYDQAIAAEAAACFDRQPGSVTILVGDIGRRFLLRDRLEPLASYPVRDVGDPPSVPPREGWVYHWKRK